MKRLSWCVAAVLLLACAGASTAQQSPVPTSQVRQATNVIVPFFQALQNGDVQTIKQYLSPSLYAQYQVLLEQNREYPDFLRKYYQGAKLQLRKISAKQGHTVVRAVINFPTGETSTMNVILKDEKTGLKVHAFKEP
jgi:hypothetical protein